MCSFFKKCFNVSEVNSICMYSEVKSYWVKWDLFLLSKCAMGFGLKVLKIRHSGIGNIFWQSAKLSIHAIFTYEVTGNPKKEIGKTKSAHGSICWEYIKTEWWCQCLRCLPRLNQELHGSYRQWCHQSFLPSFPYHQLQRHCCTFRDRSREWRDPQDREGHS